MAMVGRLPKVKIGTRLLFDIKDLDQFINKNKKGAIL
jgi:hypothetical protein